MKTRATKGLTRKTFTAKDSNGCEFVCRAVYAEPVYVDGDFVRNSRYQAHGITCNTLDALKKAVAEL